MGGVTIRAIRAMATVPDASAMGAARAVTGIVGGITPIGIATATAVDAARHLQSASANVWPSPSVIATVPSASRSIAAMATATPPRRLVRTQPGE